MANLAHKTTPMSLQLRNSRAGSMLLMQSASTDALFHTYHPLPPFPLLYHPLHLRYHLLASTTTPMLTRLLLTIINIFFPPLTILLLCGPSTDCLVNSLLFVCGVLPSHAHAFYLTCTYFSRKRKVRKGRWPGPVRGGIFSAKVQNGGASDGEVAWLEERMEAEREKGGGRRGWERR